MRADASPREQLEAFVARFGDDIASRARKVLAVMRRRLPGAFELVYDNAYALVIGFGATERPSEAVFSIVIHPKKIGLCFLQGARLRDPQHLLLGSGNQVRHIRLEDAKTLDRPEVRALMTAAIVDAGACFDGERRGRVVIRAISKRRRPRR